MRKPADVFPLAADLANPSQSSLRVEDCFAESGISIRIALKAVPGFDGSHEVGLLVIGLWG